MSDQTSTWIDEVIRGSTPADHGIFPARGAAGSLRPGGVLDRLDEVDALEAGQGAGQHIGLDVAEGGVRAVLEPLAERRDDLVLEVRSRVGLDDGGPLLLGDRVVADAQDVEL